MHDFFLACRASLLNKSYVNQKVILKWLVVRRHLLQIGRLELWKCLIFLNLAHVLYAKPYNVQINVMEEKKREDISF